MRHRHKLKPGHLNGNRFTHRAARSRAADEVPGVVDALERAGRHGVPNAFGPQRFGRDGNNPERALRVARGPQRRPQGPPRAAAALLGAAVRALQPRARARGDRTAPGIAPLAGDVLRKSDTGGIFLCADEPEQTESAPRAAKFVLTGPHLRRQDEVARGQARDDRTRNLGGRDRQRRPVQPPAALGEGTRRPFVLRAVELAVEKMTDRADRLARSFCATEGGLRHDVARLRRVPSRRERWSSDELESGRARQAAHDEFRRSLGHVAAARAVGRFRRHHARARVVLITRCATTWRLSPDRSATTCAAAKSARRDGCSRTRPRPKPRWWSPGLVEAERGPKAAEEAMAGAAALQRMKLEKRLVYLGTLGNNAPFVGLFGTVIGIVQAFDELGKAAKMQAAQTASTIAPQAVMTSIAEALVATAIGLVVAIPAVAAYNAFQRLTKSTLANTEVLSRILLAHLKAERAAPEASWLMARRIAARRRRRGHRRHQRDAARRHHAGAPHHLHGRRQDGRLAVGAARSAQGGVGNRRAGRLRGRALCQRRHHGRPEEARQRRRAAPPRARGDTPRRADLRAVIKADGTVQHQRVIHVLDLLKQAGISKIAFGVTPIAPEPGAPTRQAPCSRLRR